MQIFLRTPVLEQSSEQEIGQVSQPACPPKPSSLSSVSSEMEFAETQIPHLAQVLCRQLFV